MKVLFEQIQLRSSLLVGSKGFQRLVIGMILFSAILLGVETQSQLVLAHADLLKLIDRIVIGFFVLEILIKMLAMGKNPLRYFNDHWNIIDFVIVVGCLVPSGSNAMAVFRLVRVLRIFRLITALPKLQVIISALMKSVPSMGYVIVLLAIHFYMFGVLGTNLFSKNDPIHFQTLGRTLLTLFQVLTLEGWVDVMRIQIYGCADFGYENYINQCQQSQAQPIAAILFFISFIVLGTMTILNLLIGVVVNSMTESSIELVKTEENPSVTRSELMAQLQAISQKIDLLQKHQKEQPPLFR